MFLSGALRFCDLLVVNVECLQYCCKPQPLPCAAWPLSLCLLRHHFAPDPMLAPVAVFPLSSLWQYGALLITVSCWSQHWWGENIKESRKQWRERKKKIKGMLILKSGRNWQFLLVPLFIRNRFYPMEGLNLQIRQALHHLCLSVCWLAFPHDSIWRCRWFCQLCHWMVHWQQ